MKGLDPTIERDLDTIDAALAEGRVTATLTHDRELQELALLLEDDSPRPAPEFGARLGESVREGFPRERRMPRLRPAGLRLPRIPLPVAGALASALLALAVVLSLDGKSSERASDDSGALLAEPESGDGGGGGAERAPVPRFLQRDAGEALSRDAAGKAESTILPVPPTPGGGNFVPGRDERRIERSASMTLAAPGGELDRVADRIALVTDRHGGFVLSSQVTSGDEGANGGSFDLRIPVGNLQPALRDLAALGDVRNRSMAGRDVTRDVVSAADRLQGARAERRSLLTRLENATTDTEAEALRRRLDLNAAEIRGLRSQLRDLRLRTGYATVGLSLVAEGEDDDGSGGGSGSIDDAVDDALGSLVASLGIALRVLGVALPLGLLALAAWLGGRALRRRRREAVLG
jgi:hypothetical protein